MHTHFISKSLPRENISFLQHIISMERERHYTLSRVNKPLCRVEGVEALNSRHVHRFSVVIWSFGTVGFSRVALNPGRGDVRDVVPVIMSHEETH